MHEIKISKPSNFDLSFHLQGFEARGTDIAGRLYAYNRLRWGVGDSDIFSYPPSFTSDRRRRSPDDAELDRVRRDVDNATLLQVERCGAERKTTCHNIIHLPSEEN